MSKFWRIPDPPLDVAVRMERADDYVEFSGISRTSNDVPTLKMIENGASQTFLLGRVFLGFWTCGVLFLFGVGVVFLLFALGIVVFGDVPFEMNGKPVGTGVAVAAILAFLATWVVLGVVMYRAGRHIRLVLSMMSGDTPARQWRLRINQETMTGIQEEMGKVTARCECNREDVQQIVVKPDGHLVAQLFNESSESESGVVLAGPLDQQEGDWLVDTLKRLLGIRD